MNLFIVTGSGRGLGKALCEKLIQNKANKVVGISRTNTIQADNFLFLPCNLADSQQVLALDLPILGNYQRLVFIHNAGQLGAIKSLEKWKEKDIADTFMLNLTTPTLLAQRWMSKIQELEVPKVQIFISSGAATSAYASWAPYCSSKAGLEMLNHCIRKEQEHRPYPIFSYAIAPGVVNTDMQKQIRNTSEEDFEMVEKFNNLYAQNQLYEPELVAEKIIEVAYSPQNFQEASFRIVL
jgi:benzil reductase ((S)-benzoin forming)